MAGADLGGGCKGGAPPTPSDEAFFFVFPFKICLPHRSVTSFLRGAPPSKKNPGSAPAWAGSAPRSKPLLYHVPFMTDKAPLSHILKENENFFYIPIEASLHL